MQNKKENLNNLTHSEYMPSGITRHVLLIFVPFFFLKVDLKLNLVFQLF